MINLSASELSPHEQYKLLSGSIIPRPIAWITTQNTAGLINLAPFSFTTGISNQLPLLSVAILRERQAPKILRPTSLLAMKRLCTWLALILPRR